MSKDDFPLTIGYTQKDWKKQYETDWATQFKKPILWTVFVPKGLLEEAKRILGDIVSVTESCTSGTVAQDTLCFFSCWKPESAPGIATLLVNASIPCVLSSMKNAYLDFTNLTRNTTYRVEVYQFDPSLELLQIWEDTISADSYDKHIKSVNLLLRNVDWSRQEQIGLKRKTLKLLGVEDDGLFTIDE